MKRIIIVIASLFLLGALIILLTSEDQLKNVLPSPESQPSETSTISEYTVGTKKPALAEKADKPQAGRGHPFDDLDNLPVRVETLVKLSENGDGVASRHLYKTLGECRGFLDPKNHEFLYGDVISESKTDEFMQYLWERVDMCRSMENQLLALEETEFYRKLALDQQDPFMMIISLKVTEENINDDSILTTFSRVIESRDGDALLQLGKIIKPITQSSISKGGGEVIILNDKELGAALFILACKYEWSGCAPNSKMMWDYCGYVISECSPSDDPLELHIRQFWTPLTYGVAKKVADLYYQWIEGGQELKLLEVIDKEVWENTYK